MQVAVRCAFVLVVKQYTQMAIAEFHWKYVSTKDVEFLATLMIVLIIMRELFLLINRLEHNQIQKGKDQTSSRMISRVLKLATFVVIMLLFGEHFGMSMSGLMAFGGIGGLAIGLAGKDILSNFFSGIMLYFDRPFNIGDWVCSPDRSIEGTVAEIGWRLTKIITFDNRPLYVPNSVFSTIIVENPGRMTNRRIETEIGLRYEDANKVAVIVNDIRTMLQQHDGIDNSQTLLVNFNQFDSSSLNIMVYCFTKTVKWAEWLDIQEDVYLKIVDIVHGHGCDFAFPSRTIYIKKEAS
ncbi:mechanosensitive ion channel family protein [Advenella alkanexedens]|uniref:Mechanosensitive ion channel family protein n=2 Tax=Alcaligenaceae TaxID=506 RepID=A0ABS6NN10_9BURK|nr:mechanosensitive ion channel family protein [Advenella alkanexedens]